MPRRNLPAGVRRRRKAESEHAEAPRAPDMVVRAPAGWQVRAIHPAKATKEYRCPGCNHEIRAGTGHVVAWREGDEHHRRHWHRGCWDTHLRRARG